MGWYKNSLKIGIWNVIKATIIIYPNILKILLCILIN